jgi:hypothetical protein
MIAPAPRGLIDLLAPGRWIGWAFLSLLLAATLLGALTGSRAAPLWLAALLALAVAGLPWLLKWREDARAVGWPAVSVAALVTLQGLHALEHGVQLLQVYLLDWPVGRSLGIISSANVEWVHLAWNAGVLAGLALLLRAGMRSPWAWVLLAYALLHTTEHAYLFVRYLSVLREAETLGLGGYSVTQALPGVLGRDGWLAMQPWCGRIPGFTTAPRYVVHFVWNAGELALLLQVARHDLPELLRRSPHHPRRIQHPPGGTNA